MNIYVIAAILIIGIIIILIINKQILNRKEKKLGWKAYRNGRDEIYYEQKVNEEWKKIEIVGEILLGKICFVIYFKTKKEWLEYPKWAQNRTEIIERIKTKFPPSRTEYDNA